MELTIKLDKKERESLIADIGNSPEVFSWCNKIIIGNTRIAFIYYGDSGKKAIRRSIDSLDLAFTAATNKYRYLITERHVDVRDTIIIDSRAANVIAQVWLFGDIIYD